MGCAEAALHGFHAGHEGGAHRADAGNQNAELSVRGRNLDVSCGGQLRISLSGSL